jgi:hypothetical protein
MLARFSLGGPPSCLQASGLIQWEEGGKKNGENKASLIASFMDTVT